MFTKNGKKKIFASIMALCMMLMCLIAPRVTILQAEDIAVLGANTNTEQAGLLEEQSNGEITTRAHSGEAGTAVTVADVVWLVPVTYSRVSSYFGNRKHPITGVASNHGGMDLSVSTNNPIIAARGGTATCYYANASHTAGNYIVIDHGDGYRTRYLHMSHHAIKSGAVKAGQVIGFVGSTGGSTGAHLHYEVQQNGTKIDPFDYLGLIEI